MIKLESKLEIVYQDDWLFVINKPAQLHSVNLPNSSNQSLAALIIEQFPEQESVALKIEDGGLVQRLDFETSGLILCARNREVWNQLYAMLKSGEINKTYWGVLEGEFPKQASLDNYIGAKGRNSKKVKVFTKKVERSLQAKSEFKLLKYFRKENLSLVEVKANSAKRHQVRAHAAFLGFPFLGDDLYGAKREGTEYKLGSKFYLHARALEFLHPISGKKLSFVIERELIDVFK